jgi:hypothetical protein
MKPQPKKWISHAFPMCFFFQDFSIGHDGTGPSRRVPRWPFSEARGSAKDATAVAKDTNATSVTDAWWIEPLINPHQSTEGYLF